jgi:hypothetical protein
MSYTIKANKKMVAILIIETARICCLGAQLAAHEKNAFFSKITLTTVCTMFKKQLSFSTFS